MQTADDISHYFRNVSQLPERRARLELSDLDARREEIRGRARELAATAGAAPIPADMVEGLVQRHERATLAYWAAVGRCASWFVVGPANFPVERNRKRLNAADRRAQELQAHLTAAQRRLERIAFPHGMGDAIRSADPDALPKLRARLAGLQIRHELAKAANAILRKHGVGSRPYLAAEGIPENMIDAAMRCDHSGRPWGFFTDNSAAEIRRLEVRIAGLERIAARGTVERSSPAGVRIVENAEAHRLQLIFPGKPDDATRALLKGHGFRWAPSAGAWQRHLNGNGQWAARQVLQALEGAA